MKIKVHPLFGVLVIITIIFGAGGGMFWTFLAVLLHEMGHYLVARTRGYLMGSIVLMPFGAEMSTKENFDNTSSVLIGLAGPLTNIFLAVATVGLWWIFPTTYTITKPFLYANISMAFFNLLPTYPLDGARVLVGLAKNKLRALKVLKIVGITVGIIAFALFVVSCFFMPNFTLAVVGIFLFYGAITDRAEENYISIFSPISKDYTIGVEERKIYISKDVPLQRLLRFCGQNTICTFIIIDLEEKFTLSEKELKDFALRYKMTTPIGYAITGNAPRKCCNARVLQEENEMENLSFSKRKRAKLKR